MSTRRNKIACLPFLFLFVDQSTGKILNYYSKQYLIITSIAYKSQKGFIRLERVYTYLYQNECIKIKNNWSSVLSSYTRTNEHCLLSDRGRKKC